MFSFSQRRRKSDADEGEGLDQVPSADGRRFFQPSDSGSPHLSPQAAGGLAKGADSFLYSGSQTDRWSIGERQRIRGVAECISQARIGVVGILRFIISLLVISMHAPHHGWPYTPQSIASGSSTHHWGGLHPLHSFFVLAGFYAYLQLSTGGWGSGLTLLKYYRDRFFRLYPTFIIAIGLTLAVSLCFPVKELGSNPRWGLDKILPELSGPGKVLLCLPNVTIFGSEIPAWFNLVDGERVEVARPIGDSFPPDKPDQYIWLMWAKLVPPTFALGMMLWFFLLSPFLAAGGKWGLAAVGGLSYFSMLFFGPLFIYDGYFVWVFWLWMFCVGMGAAILHQRTKKTIHKLLSSQKHAKPLALVLLCGMVVYILSCGVRMPMELFTFVLALTFPVLAVAADGLKIDRYLGSLSYPLYCSLTIGLFLSEMAASAEMVSQSERMMITAAVGLFYAVLMVEVVEKPISRLRKWMRGGWTGA